MKRIAAALVILAIAVAAVFFWLTAPNPLPVDILAGMDEGDAMAGERIFNAGGCNSCHGGKDPAADTLPMLGGGLALKRALLAHERKIRPLPGQQLVLF